MTVSYTHLDVYKRQVCVCVCVLGIPVYVTGITNANCIKLQIKINFKNTIDVDMTIHLQTKN